MDATTQTVAQQNDVVENPYLQRVLSDLYQLRVDITATLENLKSESDYWKGYLNGYRNGSMGAPNKAPYEYRQANRRPQPNMEGYPQRNAPAPGRFNTSAPMEYYGER